MFVLRGGGGEGVLQSVKGSCVLMVAELTDKLLSKFWLSYHSQRVCHLNLYIKKFRTNEVRFKYLLLLDWKNIITFWYCWVPELTPSCNGDNVSFTYSTVVRKKQYLFNVKWKCSMMSRQLWSNFTKSFTTEGNTVAALIETLRNWLRYVARKHQWKHPLQK